MWISLYIQIFTVYPLTFYCSSKTVESSYFLQTILPENAFTYIFAYNMININKVTKGSGHTENEFRMGCRLNW